MWLLVILRLVLPWSPESEFSIYNWIGYSPSVHSAVPIQLEEGMTRADAQGAASSPVYRDIFVLVWLVGVCLLAIYTIWVNWAFALKLNKETVPVTEPRVLELFRQCKTTMKVSTPIALVQSRQLATPALFGFIKPLLILPHNMADSLNDDQLRHVLLHELAHSKRNDIRVNGLMHALLIIHWFNPVLWYAYRRMRDDQEIASDALALSCLSPDKRQDYGYTLIHLLESFSRPARVIGNVNLMGNKAQLQRRMKMIKQFKSKSYRWSFLGMAAIVFISGCALTNPKGNSNSTPLASSAVSEEKSIGANQSKVSENNSTTVDSGVQQQNNPGETVKQSSGAKADSDTKQESVTSSGLQQQQASNGMLQPAPSAEVRASASEEKAKPVPSVSQQTPAPVEPTRLVPTEEGRVAAQKGETPRPVAPEKRAATAPAPAPAEAPRLVPSDETRAEASQDRPRPVPSVKAAGN